MDVVSLPILSPTDAPADAIKAMAEQKKSAVIVDVGGSFSLMYGGDVARARYAGMKTLGHMSAESVAVHGISSSELGSFSVDVLRPLRTAANFESLLGRVGSRYGVLSTTRSEAIVITAHETLLDDLVLPGTFECDGPTVHFFPRPRVVAGQRCPACQALGISSTISYVTY